MLTIIATPTVDPTKLESVKSAMLALVKASLSEEGCIAYELHQDNEHPNRFTFVELWASRNLWQAHMNGPAITEFNRRIDGAIISIELQEMTKIA